MPALELLDGRPPESQAPWAMQVPVRSSGTVLFTSPGNRHRPWGEGCCVSGFLPVDPRWGWRGQGPACPLWRPLRNWAWAPVLGIDFGFAAEQAEGSRGSPLFSQHFPMSLSSGLPGWSRKGVDRSPSHFWCASSALSQHVS